MATPSPSATFRFRDFELDVGGYQLRRDGRSLRLERQPMDLLILLVERRGQLVSRADIVERLWGPDVFVDVDTGVHTAIRKIRQTLGDSAETPAFIETVPGKGYRFVADVEVVATAGPPPVAPSLDPSEPGPVERVTRVPVATGSRLRSRTVFTAGVAAVVLIGAVSAWKWLEPTPVTAPVKIGVLPFQNLSGDTDRDYLADGLVEETIAALGQVDPDHVSVLGRTSMMAFKHTTKSVADIGRELGADYLVEGSIQTERERLRIIATLIRARDQVQVWSASYDRELTSILALQRELSSAIAAQIRSKVSPERLTALARRQPRHSDAYDLYLRGRYFWNQLTPATNVRAVDYYERALALDPRYALAWAGIADANYASPINSDQPPMHVIDRAREAARRAVEADSQLAEAQTSLGNVLFMLEWNWPAAEKAFRQAIALDPGYALAHRNLGHVLSQAGRHDEARAVVRRARELDPLYAMNHAISSQVAFQARDYNAALEHARQAIVIDPDFWIGHMERAQAYEQLGQRDRALDDLAVAIRASSGNSKPLALRGYVLAKLGRADEARDVLRTLESVAQARYVPPYAVALVHAGLGNRAAAFEWLDRAYGARDVHLIFLPVDPKWDAYRADPRFVSLVALCGFTREH